MSARHTLLLENGISQVAFRAAGEKGSSKGGSSSSQTTHTDPNTLRSNVRARIIDLISEGEIEEIVGGLQGVYFDRTPVQNADGSINFPGVNFEYRTGLADQPELMGNAVTAAPYSVGVQVKASTGPVVRTIADKDATAVKVVATIPSLNQTVDSGKNPGLYRASVSYAFDVKPNGGAWAQAIAVTINDKCTSPYQRAHRLPLPAGGFPWQVRMRRISPDSTDDKLQNATSWDSYIEVVEARLTYMHSAVASLSVDAQQFGQSVPARSYRVRGIKFQVPTNYDPNARTYNGIWDGNFKTAWTNNPAWVFYGLVTNTRFGLGEFIDARKIDTAGLYQIAQYCDQLIDDGTGSGSKIPRYTYNGILNTLNDAHKALQNIAATFRGMSFWSLGQVFAVADMPKDPKILVTKANTIGGFEYSSTAIKARHTVATVSWNDPDDFFRPAVELVHHAEGLRRFGWRQTDIVADGCTNRAQAHYQGIWLLDTEQNETETVVYRASFDHAALDRDDLVTGILPGDVVELADPRRMRVRAGGRITGVSAPMAVEIDGDFTPLAGETYVMKVTRPDGGLDLCPIASIEGRRVNFGPTGLSQTPLIGATWIISGTQAAARQFRVLEVAEEAANIFKITALSYDPQKFDRIEKGLKLPPISYTRPKRTILPPTNLKVVESAYFRDGVQKSRLTLSWTPGADFLSMAFVVTAQTPGGFQNYGQVGSPVIDIDDVQPGEWEFTITAASSLPGVFSEPATISIEARGFDGNGIPTIADLQVLGGGSEFLGRSASFTWRAAFLPGTPPYTPAFFVRIFDVDLNALVRTERVAVPTYTYNFEDNLNDARAIGRGARRRFRIQVSAVSPTGAEGAPSALVASNPAPAKINLNLSALSSFVVFDSDTPADADLQGYRVWLSETSGFAPTDANVTLDTGFKPAMIPADEGKTYYVRAAAYDAFDKSVVSLNLSNEVEVHVSALAFDTSAPGIPPAPTLTTAVEIAPDGTVTSVVRASWVQDTSDIFGKYEIAFAQSEVGAAEPDKGYLVEGVTGAKWEKHGFIPGKLASVKVRAISANGFGVSGFSPVATITAAANTTPPNPVSGFAITGGFQNAFLSWTASTSKDVDFVEVWAVDGDSGGAAPPNGATRLATVAAGTTTWADNTLPTTGTRTYWLRPVNTSGTAAAGFAGPGKATSAAIQKGQLQAGAVDATKFASDIAVTSVVTTLPTTRSSAFVTLQSDGKLYRWDATRNAYTAAIDAGMLTGKITRTQIGDGEVSTPQLAAGAVTAGILNAASVFGDQGVFNSLTAGIASFGGLSAAQIKAGAITADKIGVGLSTGNLVWGSDCRVPQAALRNYQNFAATGPYAGVYTGALWSPTGMAAIQTSVYGSPGSPGSPLVMDVGIQVPQSDGSYTAFIPCTPGQRYEFSGYLSVHRCTAAVQVSFFDSNQNYVNEIGGNQVPYDGEATGTLDKFPRSGGFVTAPANAAYMLVYARGYLTGGANPNVFASALYLAAAQPNQTQLSPWAPQSNTVISGGQVATNSLLASSIVAGSITTDRFTANTIDAVILNLDTLKSRVVNTGLLTADSITVGNGNLSSVINGTNTTKISGGALQANSVAANTLKVGARGLVFWGIEFSADKNTNQLSWTAGGVSYVDDAGNNTYVAISANSIPWNGWVGVYWFKGRGYLDWANDGNGGWNAHAANPDAVSMCFYSGWTGLNVTRGGTTIDGTRINTGTLTANQIAAGQIQTQHMSANSISGDRITAGSLAVDKLTSGTITAGTIYLQNDRFWIDGGSKMIRIRSVGSDVDQLSIGNVGLYYGNGSDYGMIIRNLNGDELLRVAGGYARMTGAIIDDATITTAKIGTAQVDYLRVAGGAVSQVVAASSGGQTAALVLYCRGPDSKFECKAFRRGNASGRYNVTSDPGALYIEYSTNGNDYGVLDGIPNVVAYQYDQGPKANYTLPQATTLMTSWAPSYTGNLWFRVRDSNGMGIGGVYISVTELAK